MGKRGLRSADCRQRDQALANLSKALKSLYIPSSLSRSYRNQYPRNYNNDRLRPNNWTNTKRGWNREYGSNLNQYRYRSQYTRVQNLYGNNNPNFNRNDACNNDNCNYYRNNDNIQPQRIFEFGSNRQPNQISDQPVAPLITQNIYRAFGEEEMPNSKKSKKRGN